MDIIEKLTTALYAEGTPCDFGINECDLAAYIEIAHEINNSKPIRAVTHWSWWDLNVTDAIRETVHKETGLQPALINAHVIYDSSNRFPKGAWIRTTALVEFHKNVIFETKNTLYILVGSGDRKTVDLEIALAFF